MNKKHHPTAEKLLGSGAAWLMACGSSAVGLAYVLLAISRLNASPFELGTAAAILQAFTISSTWLFGRLADRIGHRILPVISGTVYALLALVLSHVTSITQIYLLMVGFGLCLGAFWPSMEVSFGENAHGKVLLRRVGGFNLSWSFGVAVGPQIAGFLFTNFGRSAFYIPAAMAGMAAVGVLLRPSPIHKEKAVEQKTAPSNERTRDAFLYAAWISNFGAWFVVGVLRSLFPKLAESLKLSGTEIGFLLLLWAVAMASMFGLLSLSPRWTYRSMPLIVFQGVLALGILMIYRVSALPLLALGVILVGIGCGVTYSSSLFYALDGYADKGAKSGIHEVVLGAGSLVGPFLCGVAAQQSTLRAPYLICAGAMALCMISSAALLRNHRQEVTAIKA